MTPRYTQVVSQAQILDGLAVSRALREEVKTRVDALRARGIVPHLHAMVAAQDPASLAYVKMKRSWCAKAGIESGSTEVTGEWTQGQLIEKIRELNADPAVHGILLQHPLPAQLDEDEALVVLGATKDVDGISPESLGRLACDLPGFRAATPFGMMKILDHYGLDVSGKRAVVVGRSVILGKPAALLLLQRNATVTIAHSRTKELSEVVREADVVVAAVGRPEMIRGEWLKPGAIVLDAGYNKVEGRDKDVGDVHFESALERAAWITPVPGGVGPMTVATLMSNCVDAAEKL